MANELRFPTNRPGLGTTPKALVWNASGQVHNGSAFVTYATASRATYLKSVTEQGTASGVYVGSLGFTPTTDVFADLYDGSTESALLIGVQAINLAAESVTAEDVLGGAVPDGYAQGTAGWALGRIGSGRVTTVSPVAQSGDLTLVAGDSYRRDQGRALSWTDVDAAWPTLTEAEVFIEVGDGVITAGGYVTTATGAGKQVGVQLMGDQTDVDAGVYPFRVVAIFPGTGSGSGGAWEDRVTLVEGVCTITDREDE